MLNLKENLQPEEALMILDFAEKHSFIVQDAAQGLHWENSQANLHPFVAYFRDTDQLEHISMSVISECFKRNTKTEHRFSQDVLAYLKGHYLLIKKIHNVSSE